MPFGRSHNKNNAKNAAHDAPTHKKTTNKQTKHKHNKVDVLPAWSAPLQIVRYPDPRLRAPNAKIAVFDDGLAALAAAMMDVMYE